MDRALALKVQDELAGDLVKKINTSGCKAPQYLSFFQEGLVKISLNGEYTHSFQVRISKYLFPKGMVNRFSGVIESFADLPRRYRWPST